MGCVLGQHDKTGRKEQAIYYLSKRFVDYETRFTPFEKTCLALVYVTKRLRHYFFSYKVFLISPIDPIKYIFEKLATIGRTARWLMMLSEFDITSVSQKAIKEQAIDDFLIDGPIEEPSSLSFDFPDEHILCVEVELNKIVRWKMCFDGAANQIGCGVGAILISPTGALISIAVRLCFPCTNNIAEYEACIIGLKVAIDLGINELEVYGDSALVIFQATGDWFIRKEKFLDYHECLQILSKSFECLTFDYIGRNRNQFADALATLASMIDVPQGAEMRQIGIEQRIKPAYCLQIATIDLNREPWFHDIKNYHEDKTLPSMASKNDQRALRRLAA